MKLRELHAAMDRAVLDAYGWADIQPRCEFILDYEDDEDETPGKPSKKRKPWRYGWPDEIRDDVRGWLLELNAQTGKGRSTCWRHCPCGKRKERTWTEGTPPGLSARLKSEPALNKTVDIRRLFA